MIETLFTTSTMSYFILGVFAEYQRMLGKQITDNSGRSNIYNLYWNITTISGAVYLFYYSYQTKWWAFIGLIILNILTFVVIDVIVTQSSKHPGDNKSLIAFYGRIISPILIVLMFLLAPR